MKILISSNRFSPDIGGIETCTELLAREWERLGHEVTIVTASSSDSLNDDLGFRVVRNPGAFQLLRLVEATDVFFHNNISLRTAWPLLLLSRPWFVTTAIWIVGNNNKLRLRDRLKRMIVQLADNLHISRVMRAHVDKRGPIVGNPFDREKFRIMDDIKRERDLFFLGRLVSDKGVDVLIQALAFLKENSVLPTTSIIGDGPEKPKLEKMANDLGLSETIIFHGFLKESELVKTMNQHQIQVIPSTWEEPFGIAALEGMACGCVVVAAQSGGLPEVVKDAGVCYPKHDAKSLANHIVRLTTDAQYRDSLKNRNAANLQRFHPNTVARKYLAEFFRYADQSSTPCV